MRTNIVLNDTLVQEAFLLTGLKTKRELVNVALQELVNLKKSLIKPCLSETFAELRQLTTETNPFPVVKRQNRTNPFADQL